MKLGNQNACQIARAAFWHSICIGASKRNWPNSATMTLDKQENQMTTQTPITEKRVDEIMTKRVETLTPNDTIKDAVNLMIDSKVNTVPVVDHENKCIGILSRTDLTEMFMEEDNHLSDVLDTERLSMDWVHHSLETSNKKLVKELMNYDVATVRNNQKLTDACHLMSLHQIHHLPVVDDLDAVVGIVSTFDIVSALAKEF